MTGWAIAIELARLVKKDKNGAAMMRSAEDAPKMIDADLRHDLIRRLCDLEAIVKQLNERPRPGARRAFWSARSRPARIGAAAMLVVLGASMVFAQTDIKGLFVDKSGNVGIGTTEPGNYTLRVNGSLSVAGPVKVGAELHDCLAGAVAPGARYPRAQCATALCVVPVGR